MSEEMQEITEVSKKRKPRTKSVEDAAPEVIVDSNISEAEETQIAENDNTVITGPKRQRAPRKSNMHTKGDGSIGSHAADAALINAPSAVAKVQKKEDPEKVALWSAKNIRWSIVGELSKGYNIVTKEAAEKWLTQRGIRLATPEEVATYYSK